jgi:hypothetical protein
MTRARARVLAALLTIAAGCDVVVESGQTVEPANRGSVWAVNSPNAVRVRPGGTLIVRDADLFGLGKVVTTIPAGPFPMPGAAIEASGGTVRIVKGRIAGGNVLVQVDPNSFPIPADPSSSPGEMRFASMVGVPIANLASLAGALEAFQSTVEIAGGTLVGSSVFGRPNPYLSPFAVVSVFGGQLRILGGEFLPATMVPPSPLPSGGSSVSALDAFVEISGGRFDAGPVVLAGANARITGGSFGSGLAVNALIQIDPSLLPGPRIVPCYAIAGGSFSRIAVASPDPVFIVGSQFNLPLGPVTSPAPPPHRSAPALPVRLTGVLQDGTPIDLDLIAPPGTQVSLVASGTRACSLLIID